MAAKKKSAASKMKRKPAKKAAGPAKRKVAVKTVKRGAKSAVAKKAVKATASVAKKSGPIKVGSKPFSKSQFVSEISERTGVSRKEVVAMMETVSDVIHAHLQKQGPEIFSWPGLFKIQITKKPATKARQGINPFTGETMMFKAKPASRRVKVRPLKQLKAMAG
jgi:nucleoid DNA-binding protein